jgi:hypothetical protein
MLDATLATRFEPGTNVRGEVAGANWTFLLPSLELGRVLCVGVPRLAELRTLARLARDVWVLVARRAEGEPIRRAAADAGLAGVRVIVTLAEAGFGSGSVDLVVACGSRGARSLRREASLRPVLERCLATGGVVWLESRGPRGGELARELARERGLRLAPLRLGPRRGEVVVAAAAGDARVIDFLARRGLLDATLGFVPRALARRAEASRFAGALVRRAARTGWLAGAGPAGDPPEYLRAIAAHAGTDLAGLRVALAAPGRYASRKVVLFFFERASDKPRLVVKMTRDAAWNARLENEYRSLQRLAELGRAFENRAPRALFFGRHGGLAVVGESALDGVPLSERTRGTADCPVGSAAIDWIVDLGAASAGRVAAEPPVLADALGQLLARFVEIYPLSDSERGFLADQIRLLGKHAEPVPLVFQHGDPGVWNAIWTRAGRVAFLDWEAGEPEGVPLWDLFYFLRSYGMQTSRSRGRRDWLEKSARPFLGEGALHDRFARAVRRAATASRLPAGLVEPLFFTCWMHRALKEATRLRGRGLAQGRYLGLLQLFVERRQEHGLRRLLEV